VKTAIWKKPYAKREKNCEHGGNNWKKKCWNCPWSTAEKSRM
jgi:hypothetical protein